MKRYVLHILRNVIGCIPRSRRVGNFWPAFVGVGAALFTGCMTVAPAQAEDFGHRVKIIEKDGEKRLTIDGKTIVKDTYVSIDEKRTVAGVGVLIGSSSGVGLSALSRQFSLYRFQRIAPFVCTVRKVTAARSPTKLKEMRSAF